MTFVSSQDHGLAWAGSAGSENTHAGGRPIGRKKKKQVVFLKQESKTLMAQGYIEQAEVFCFIFQKRGSFLAGLSCLPRLCCKIAAL